jgi:hypothetical protein
MRYAKTFIKTASVVSCLLSDIRAARTATDVKKFHSNLDNIPGIGETIASKLVMYILRELPYFGSSIHPRELYPAVKPILKEYHNANLAKKLKNHYGADIVEEVFDVLKGLGDPFAIDALYYIDREEPELKNYLLKMATDDPDGKEWKIDEDRNEESLEVTLPKDKYELLGRIAKKEFVTDGATLARFWILDRLYPSSTELKATNVSPLPVTEQKEEPTTNLTKMKQIIEKVFGSTNFTKKKLVCAVHTEYPQISDDQISPHDWSVNTKSGERNKNAYLIRKGNGDYVMRKDSVDDGYKYINGVWLK